ncbi:MAG: TrmJ/YjtD family RNA methyltransferase [Elusimicrobiota bacterium]|jgi:tRNA/rRNA methyltransferase|nr:TrmJ/YjtD family RNA methyltransferase [Elusimicrobiota bacterium]
MHISIILARPRNPQNIGAAARAMANFGLNDLRIVSPHPPVWEEVRTAVHAGELIKNAKIFPTLAAALHDADFILATTALQNRRVSRQIISLPDVSGILEEHKNCNTAIVFGPEKTGLTADEIALADAVLNIPTASKTPSINLAQAVVLCCYEISKNKMPARKNARGKEAKEADFKSKQMVIDNFQKLLDGLGLPPTLNRRVRQERLLDLRSKTRLSKENIFFLNSLINRIMKKLG